MTWAGGEQDVRLAGRDRRREHTPAWERKACMMETIPGNGETGLLTPLFEATLQYRSEMEVVVSAETREGEQGDAALIPGKPLRQGG